MRSRTWSPSGFVNAALRKRLSGDLDGLGRPGSPRGRWIPPFGGSVLHVRTLELYYVSRRGKPPCWWAGGSKAVGLAPLLLLRPSDYSHQILTDRQDLVPP